MKDNNELIFYTICKLNKNENGFYLLEYVNYCAIYNND